MRDRWWILGVVFLAGSIFLLTTCTPQVETVTVTAPPETVVVTATPSPTPFASPLPVHASKALTVCLIGEPDTLYLYGGSRLPATAHVMSALYDGPIDHVSYGYRPVILEELPSVTEGDVVTRAVRVREGDRVVDAAGEVVELAEGVLLRPSGCYTEGCTVEFTGEPTWMERMAVTFDLRADITWSDGEALTAADSVFAFDMASAPATPGGRFLVERTEAYRAFGERRVQWVGVPGFRDPTYFLNFFAPLPRHQLAGRSATTLLRAPETTRTPLTWGPFVVDEWTPGGHLTMRPNPHYFRADEGLPRLDRLTFLFSAGPAEVVARVLSGACDLGPHDVDLGPVMPLLVAAEQKGLLSLAAAPSDRGQYLTFGIVPSEEYDRPDFFGDVRTRQAIAQCIDRPALAAEAVYGLTAVPDSYLPASHPLHAGDELARWPYDPGAARALLEEVGWLDEDGDGVLEAREVEGVARGTSFEVALLLPADDAVAQQAARIVRANLVDCGILLTLEPQSLGALAAPAPDGTLFGRRFDLAERSWWIEFASPCETFLSSQIPDRENESGSNVAGYINPTYDAVCQEALRILPGHPSYRDARRQAQVIFSQDLPAVPLFLWPRVTVLRPRVLNFTLDATAPGDLGDAEHLDVE